MIRLLRGVAFSLALLGVIDHSSGFSGQEQNDLPRMGRFLREITGVWPEHVRVTERGQILVHDLLERRVRVFDLQGDEQDGNQSVEPWYELDAALLKSVHLPTDAALALAPRLLDVAIDDTGRHYFVDGANHRVVCIDKDGQQVWSIGGMGTFPGQFVEPTAIAHAHGSNMLFVTDAQNHRVQVFNLNGEFQYEWGKHALVPREGQGKIHYPNDIAVSPDGSFVVVAEVFERRLQIFGPVTHGAENTPIALTPPPSVQSHFGSVMGVDGRLAAVWEPELRRVLVFDMGREAPIQITQFGSYGTKLGQFSHIVGLAVNEESRTIYVLDSGTMRIDVVELQFDSDAEPKFDPLMAKFVRSMPLREIIKDVPLEPIALDWFSGDSLAVIDAEHAHVHEVTLQGALRGSWHVTIGEGQRCKPVALAVNESAERIYVADEANRAIAVFDLQRSFLHLSNKPGLRRAGFLLPSDVCIAEDGSIFVVDSGLDAVIKCGPNGEFTTRWGSTGVETGQLWSPAAIGIDQQGRVVVLDYGNHRGQLFSQDGEWQVAFSAGRVRTRSLNPPVTQPSKPE